MPTFTAGASDDEWCHVAESRAFPPEYRSAARISCGGSAALFAENHDTEPGPSHRRSLLTWSTGLDVAVQHHTPPPNRGQGMTEVPATIAKTLQVHTNAFEPESPGLDISDDYSSAAHAATAKKDWHEVLVWASRAMPYARSSYLVSVVHQAPVPEIPGIWGHHT